MRKGNQDPNISRKGNDRTNDEKETTPTTTKCAKDEIMDINEKKQTTPWATPRSKISSNDT
jgi:hypothetical protein